ncbi:hypothetical protein RKD27_006856 [Streptomyces sp. SAI-126]
MQSDRPSRARDARSHGRRVLDMRRTRIEKRRPVRARRYPEETYGPVGVLDPRDPDIVRAKRLRAAQHGGTHRL